MVEAVPSVRTSDGAEPPLEFLDRDLTWLEFNHRVLHEAMDPRTPLLEQARFMAIFTSNLDEFFMKRMGRLRRAVNTGNVSKRPEEMNPAQIFRLARQKILQLLKQQADCFRSSIEPQLRQHGVYLLRWPDLSEKERDWANHFFMMNVFPILTPLAVDPGHPFPFISNLSTSLGVLLSHPERDEQSFARVKAPEVLPQWIRVNGGNGATDYRFVSLLELIRQNLQELFPGMRVLDAMPFRLTRDLELEHDDDEADDLRERVEEELRQRRFAQAVRLEHSPNPNPEMLQFLMQELKLTQADIYENPAELDFTDLRVIAQVPLPQLRFEPWVPTVPTALADENGDIFNLIRTGDVLVHHPYESFNASVERFIQAAADDPKVLAIKMTVYRTGDDSPFIRTLIRAAEAKKQVVCLVELNARLDEERNILLAQSLEKAGVHVVYGLVGLKTHTKTALVVRQDTDGIRCYAHISTGNYHVETARLYTDLGLLTCRPEITGDMVKLFHYLTGRSLQRDYERLIVAPGNMRERFLAMIERETSNHLAGKPAYILAKMNSLEDHKINRALFKASEAGVKVDLIVRGFCVLRPGLPGFSENIRIMSVVGRFLEHSRIFYFRNAAENPVDGEFYIGSADWMYRNLLYRVEVVAPIEARPLRERVWELLNIYLNDNRSAWDMKSDGTYVQRQPAKGDPERGAQQVMMALSRQRSVAAGLG
ncbi:MAG: polyphosphate kinase 1 [Tepidisphaerales bacterium]